MLEARSLPLEHHKEYSASTTKAFYSGFLTENQVQSLSQSICASVEISDTRICSFFGYGSQSTATYRELACSAGVDVPWHRNFGPWWLKPLTWLAASRGGLVFVETTDKVGPIMESLSSLAMVELYSCRSPLRTDIIEYVKNTAWRSRPGIVVSRDSSYFAFGFDGDSSDEEGRFYTWCSYGTDHPKELSECLSNFIL